MLQEVLTHTGCCTLGRTLFIFYSNNNFFRLAVTVVHADVDNPPQLPNKCSGLAFCRVPEAESNLGLEVILKEFRTTAEDKAITPGYLIFLVHGTSSSLKAQQFLSIFALIVGLSS